MYTRHSYWSSSTLANIIRNSFSNVGSNKPISATLEDWKSWKKSYKQHNPKIYWFTEKFLNKLQNIVYWPYDRYRDVKYFIINGFFDKSHMLKTKLKFGGYHEVNNRMLHGLFETLVDFIEIEKAWMGVFNKKEEYKKCIKWWKPFRCPEAGLSVLEWEMTLFLNDLDENGEEIPFTSNPRQAESAKEQLVLYDWWKNIRPFRIDPYALSGFNKENGYSDKSYQKLEDITKSYDEEDEEMLIRLIKIRSHLWT